MLRRLFRRLSYANVMSTIAVFGVLAGGTAYAANTIGSADIIDGQVKSVDVANQDLTGGDIKDGSLTTFDLADGAGVTGADVLDQSLTGFDIKDGQIGQVDIADTAINSAKVADNSLTGADINESALNLPNRARYVPVSGFDSRVASTQVPEGNYLVYIAANQRTEVNDGTGKSVSCSLYNRAAGQADPGDFIGEADDVDRTSLANPNDVRTATHENMSTMGGAAVGPGGATIYALCVKEGASRSFFTGAMWVIQTGGFF